MPGDVWGWHAGRRVGLASRETCGVGKSGDVWHRVDGPLAAGGWTSCGGWMDLLRQVDGRLAAGGWTSCGGWMDLLRRVDGPFAGVDGPLAWAEHVSARGAGSHGGRQLRGTTLHGDMIGSRAAGGMEKRQRPTSDAPLLQSMARLVHMGGLMTACRLADVLIHVCQSVKRCEAQHRHAAAPSSRELPPLA
eukprot:355929-Chlamydomonas_euryale.AAC.7